MSTMPGRSKASFDYGYREVRVKLPDGRYRRKRVPLTLEDVLHPRFGDGDMLATPTATTALTSGMSSRPGTPTTSPSPSSPTAGSTGTSPGSGITARTSR